MHQRITDVNIFTKVNDSFLTNVKCKDGLLSLKYNIHVINYLCKFLKVFVLVFYVLFCWNNSGLDRIGVLLMLCYWFMCCK